MFQNFNLFSFLKFLGPIRRCWLNLNTCKKLSSYLLRIFVKIEPWNFFFPYWKNLQVKNHPLEKMNIGNSYLINKKEGSLKSWIIDRVTSSSFIWHMISKKEKFQNLEDFIFGQGWWRKPKQKKKLSNRLSWGWREISLFAIHYYERHLHLYWMISNLENSKPRKFLVLVCGALSL